MANNNVVNATENTEETKVGFFKKHGKTIGLVAGTAIAGIAAGVGLAKLFASKNQAECGYYSGDDYESDDSVD